MPKLRDLIVRFEFPPDGWYRLEIPPSTLADISPEARSDIRESMRLIVEKLIRAIPTAEDSRDAAH